MKKIFFTIALMSSTIVAFGQTWTLDKAHAKLGFNVTHMMVSEVDGSFKNFDLKVTSSKDDFSDAVVELTADVNSIDTDNDNRDKDLKSDKFFDAAKYPILTFKSTSIKKAEGKKYKLAGDLTLHGVTKPVVLDVILNGTTTHPMNKKTIAGFKALGTIKRSDFNLGSAPAAVISDEVNIVANIEINK
ncbi:YceI family protein [Cytophagaceae bacterium YF14B1]|uniref:YceI family protein n=1 Tax=Xanthocytophaga flava TaxID=3048013 RepID=A0AAE3QI16_9BACT|nr:YceI family protein [Xanthocytophaga flavus]MDJ1479742.1 YceI family protein [Xanthocytophaga flavus]